MIPQNQLEIGPRLVSSALSQASWLCVLLVKLRIETAQSPVHPASQLRYPPRSQGGLVSIWALAAQISRRLPQSEKARLPHPSLRRRPPVRREYQNLEL